MGHHHRVIELLKLLHNTAGSNAQVRLWNITPNKLCKIHYFVHYFNPTNNDFNMFLFKTKTSRDIRDNETCHMTIYVCFTIFLPSFPFTTIWFTVTIGQVFRSQFCSLFFFAKFSVHNFVHYFFCQVFRSLFFSLFFFAKFSVHYFFHYFVHYFFCQVSRSLCFSLILEVKFSEF